MWRKSVVSQSKRGKKQTKKNKAPALKVTASRAPVRISVGIFSGDGDTGLGLGPVRSPPFTVEGRRAEARRFVPTTQRITTRCGPSDPASSWTALRPPVPGRARRPRVPRRGRRAAGGPRAPRCPAGPRRGAPRGAESSLRSSGVALRPPGSSPPARDLLVGSEWTDVHSQGHSAERQRG